jgi:hypothetical protein
MRSAPLWNQTAGTVGELGSSISVAHWDIATTHSLATAALTAANNASAWQTQYKIVGSNSLPALVTALEAWSESLAAEITLFGTTVAEMAEKIAASATAASGPRPLDMAAINKPTQHVQRVEQSLAGLGAVIVAGHRFERLDDV